MELLDTCIRTTTVVPIEMIIARARVYLKEVMQVQDWQNKYFLEFGLVCENLAWNLKDREPTEAEEYVYLLFAAFLKSSRHKRAGFLRDTDNDSYRTMENKSILICLAKSLIIQGIVSTSVNDQSVAEEAFKLAVLIPAFCIGGPAEKDLTKKLEVIYQAWKGLSIVARSKEEQALFKERRLEVLKKQTLLLRSRYITFRQDSSLGSRVVPPVEKLGMNFETSDGYTELIDILDVEWDSPRPGPDLAVGLNPLKLLNSYEELQQDNPGPYLDVLQEGLKRAMEIGRKGSEYLYRWKLIELAIAGWEWEVAAQHIHLIQELEQDNAHGPWPSSTVRRRNLARVQWGAVFLRLGDIEQALKQFPKGHDSAKPHDYVEAKDWASVAQFIVIYNLLSLNASWIDWMPPTEVKQLMSKAHDLITRQAQKRWPNYIPEQLDLNRPIGNRLDWHYHDSVESTRPFLENEPGKALYTIARIFQRIFLQPRIQRTLLIRKVSSPSAWPFANRKAKAVIPFWPIQLHDIHQAHPLAKGLVPGFMIKEFYRCRYRKTRTLIKKALIVDVNGMYAWSLARRMSRSVELRVRSDEQETIFQNVASFFQARADASVPEMAAQPTSGKEVQGDDETVHQSIGLTL